MDECIDLRPLPEQIKQRFCIRRWPATAFQHPAFRIQKHHIFRQHRLIAHGRGRDEKASFVGSKRDVPAREGDERILQHIQRGRQNLPALLLIFHSASSFAARTSAQSSRAFCAGSGAAKSARPTTARSAPARASAARFPSSTPPSTQISVLSGSSVRSACTRSMLYGLKPTPAQSDSLVRSRIVGLGN